MILSIQDDQTATAQEITLPDTVADVTYSAYLDFRKPIETFVQAEMKQQQKERKETGPQEVTAKNIHEIAKQINEEPDEPEQEELSESGYFVHVFRYFSLLLEMGGYIERPELVELTLKATGAIAKGDLSELPFYHEGDKLAEMLENGVDWFDEKGASVTRLFCHLAWMFNSYVAAVPLPSETFSREYEGETYYIEPDQAARVLLAGNPLVSPPAKGYTVNEVSAITELERIFKAKIEKDGDPDGALLYQLDLCVLAVLFRKNNEKLPINPEQRNRFIDQRSQHFKALPMDIVLQVRFFLARSLQNWLVSRIMRPTLAMAQSFPNLTQGATADTKEQPKPTKKLFRR